MLSIKDKVLLKRLKPKNTILLQIKERIFSYSLGTEGRNYVAKPLFAVLKGNLVNSKTTFTVVDPTFTVERGIAEISVDALKNEEKYLKKRFKDSKTILENNSEHLGILVDSFDAKKVFERLGQEGVKWPEMVNYLLDDTGTKDERIINLVKSQMVRFPLSEHMLWQPFNNHAICLTNTGTAKTTTYTRIGIKPSSDYSVPGLVGTVKEKGEVQLGTLAGTGTVALDEFTEEVNSNNTEIVNHILDYLEQGYTKRSLSTPIECVGTKAVTLLGNCSDLNPKPSEFRKAIVKIATADSLARVGRRFGLIYFGNDFKKVQNKRRDIEAVSKLRVLINSALNQNEVKIKRILNMCLDWLEEEDKEYKEKVMSYSRHCSENLLNEFIYGNARASSRIKMAGLKQAIVDNLDKITISKGYKKLVNEVILPEAKKNYQKFKEYNYKSFDKMVDKKMMLFEELVRAGVSKDRVIKETGVSTATYYRWLERLKIAELAIENGNVTEKE